VAEHVELRVGRWLARWVDTVVRRPLVTTAVLLAATALALLFTLGNLGIQGSTESLFSPELPFKQVERRYVEAFPMLYENLFVVVDAPTPELAGEAASKLAARLRQESDYFHHAFLPGGGEFFEEHAFLYLSTDELEDLADRLAEVQPYIGELSRDGTLRGLASMLGRGVRAVRDGDVSGDQLVTIFEQMDEALRAATEGRSYHLSWAEVLAGSRFDAEARRPFLMVQPVLDHQDLQPAKRSILRVREVVRELGLTPANGFNVRVTGDAALSYEEMEVVRNQAAKAGLASFVLVGLILSFALRSVRLVLSTLLTLLVGLVLTTGFTALTIGHLNLISVTFAVLFIGLGVDFGIHLCIRYRELMGGKRSHAEALSETARDVGSSIALCALTTSIGFLAFAPTDFIGVAELGVIAGSGMFISLFCTVTLLPALLSLPPVPAPGSAGGGVSWSSVAFTALPLRHPRLVRATALALGLGAVFLLPRARFDNNPLHVRDPSSESVRALSELLERGSTSPWSLNAVAPDLETARRLSERLRELEVVESVLTVSDLIPTDQEKKLGIIEDVAMFLPSLPGHGGTAAMATPQESNAALRILEREVRKLLAEGPPGQLREEARSLQEALVAYLARLEASEDGAALLTALESSVIGSLPAQLRLLEASLTAGHVTLENLPDALLERMITEDGRVRIQVFARADLDDPAALAEFVDTVREVVPEVAGSAAEILESGRTVVGALQQALLAAVVAVTILLLVLWRSVNETALVLVPLGLAAALTVAAAVLLDIPFNFADVIVLPLLLGIGVDSGIHLVHRARVSGPRGRNLLATSTARAVVYSGFTTIASFGTMGFASHLGLATLGRLLTLGVGFTLLCNLIVLPALIALRAPRPAVVEGDPLATRRARSS
jgi:hopanoid biosynthesis associated RND transporter like protein HpnN